MRRRDRERNRLNEHKRPDALAGSGGGNRRAHLVRICGEVPLLRVHGEQHLIVEHRKQGIIGPRARFPSLVERKKSEGVNPQRILQGVGRALGNRHTLRLPDAAPHRLDVL